jgi:hypothetical protein
MMSDESIGVVARSYYWLVKRTVESLISKLDPSAWKPDTPDTICVWLTRIQGQDTAETTLPCAPSLLTTQLNI